MQKVWEEVKDRLKVEDVVGEYVPLKPAGQNLRGLCPFHHEKSPSFMVSPQRQIWHCFGCGEGGDVYAFIKKIEGVEFADALKILAKKAGVELKREDPKVSSKRTKVLDVLSSVARYYRDEFTDSSDLGALAAREYIYRKRGVTPETADTWGLGYAGDAWDGAYIYLKEKGFTDEDIFDAGITVRKTTQRGFFDRFRGRVMFPVRDQHGVVVGFGGRVIVERPNEGKYINSPQTLVYNKSEVVYGLDRAKDGIRREKYVVLVEGNMDCISSHQAGVTHVVASSGTALTQGQLTLLKRYTDTIALAFDVDTAGQLALKRSLELAFEMGLTVEVVPLDGAKDPDELIRRDPELWNRALARKVSVLQYFVTQRLAHTQRAESAKVKKELMDDLAPLLARLSDPVERAHYSELISAGLGIASSAVMERVRQYKSGVAAQGMAHVSGVGQRTSADGARGARMAREQFIPSAQSLEGQAVKMAARLISLILVFPQYIDDIQGEWFPSKELRALWDELTDAGVEGFMKRTDAWSQRLFFLKESQEETMPIHELEEELFKARAYIWQFFLRNEQKRFMHQLKDDTALANKDEVMRMLKKVNEELYKAGSFQ